MRSVVGISGLQAGEDVNEYGITIEEITQDTSRRATGRRRSKAEPKYRGPNGELWSGGPGRKPEWVRQVIASGDSIERYRIAA
jgi:DNA-binding protein H-NS